MMPSSTPMRRIDPILSLGEKAVKLTKDEIRFLERVASHQHLGVADRAADKVRQSARRRGLARFDRSTNKWEVTPEGRAALAEAKL